VYYNGPSGPIKRPGISCLAERLLASRERICSNRFDINLLVLSRVLVNLDAGLDRLVDLLEIHQVELQLIITLSILL
jgi:hypothetical protein